MNLDWAPVLYWVNIMVTFALFCGVCMRMWHTPDPGKCWNCRIQWLLWVVCHGVVGLVVLAIVWDNLAGPMTPVTPRYLAMKASLAVLFLFPWNTKAVGL